MPFAVQDFLSKMVFDGARNNLFECTITFPTNVVPNPIGASERYTFFARSAQLPGSTVNQVPVNYFGRELKFAGNRTFPEWTVTIINDEDFMVRNAFERWMDGLNTHRSNLRLPGMVNNVDYMQDGTVIQYGKAGDPIKQYNFIGMFPVDISPIDVDWSTNDAIEEYAVTFAYQWWEQIQGEALFNITTS
jgi:T4-like virus tail tube protein gp19